LALYCGGVLLVDLRIAFVECGLRIAGWGLGLGVARSWCVSVKTYLVPVPGNPLLPLPFLLLLRPEHHPPPSLLLLLRLLLPPPLRGELLPLTEVEGRRHLGRPRLDADVGPRRPPVVDRLRGREQVFHGLVAAFEFGEEAGGFGAEGGWVLGVVGGGGCLLPEGHGCGGGCGGGGGGGGGGGVEHSGGRGDDDDEEEENKPFDRGYGRCWMLDMSE